MAENFYLCDPAKNTGCKKTSCQKTCRATTDPAYAKQGKAAEVYDLLVELADTIPDYGEYQKYYDEVFDRILELAGNEEDDGDDGR
jgi:hypothetical protein